MRDDIKNSRIFFWIISIVVAFYSGSAVSVVSSGYRNSIVYVAAFFFAVRLIERRFWVSKSKRSLFLAYFIIMIIMTATVTGYSTFYLRLFATIYVAYEISERMDCKQFIELYEKTILCVTIIALIGYFFVNALGLGSRLPGFVNVNGEVYRGVVIFNYIERLPERNCALFWEPGIFASALTFALIFELIYQKEKHFFRIVLFVIGIITTNSTAGYVLLVLLLVLASMKIQAKLRLVKILLLVVQIAIVIASITIFLNLDKILVQTKLSQNEVFAKLMSDTLIESQRGRAIQDSLSSFAQSPLFGNGAIKIVQEMNYVADTATSVYVLSIFGVLGFGYSIFYITGVFMQRNLNIVTRMILLIIVFCVLNKEPHLDLLFTWIFGFFLLKKAESD